MSMFRRISSILATASMASLWLLSPATGSTVQAHRFAPFPSCGDHFTLSRSGAWIRVVGVDLKAFSNAYMLVWAAANGEGHGPYNASPYGGANFEFDSGSTSKTTVAISLTNTENTVTLCAADYNE
jgi:hypothetical protein